MAKRHEATSTNVEDYWQLFVNRRAYVLQAMRPHPESGRYYYFRPKAGKNGEPHSLTAATIRRHLEGELTLGVYAMNPSTQRCKWIAMDGDYKESLKHLCELQWELQQQKVEAALEQSRRGAHLWIFGAQPLLARQCRLLISGLAAKLGIPVKGTGTAEGIEIFPKHDELKDGDFGNAIRGPLEFTGRSARGFGSTAQTTTSTTNWHFSNGSGSFRRSTWTPCSRSWDSEGNRRRRNSCRRRAGSIRHNADSFTSWTTSRCGGRSGGTGLHDVLRAPRRIETGAATTSRSRLTNRRSTSAGPVAPKK